MDEERDLKDEDASKEANDAGPQTGTGLTTGKGPLKETSKHDDDNLVRKKRLELITDLKPKAKATTSKHDDGNLVKKKRLELITDLKPKVKATTSKHDDDNLVKKKRLELITDLKPKVKATASKHDDNLVKKKRLELIPDLKPKARAMWKKQDPAEDLNDGNSARECTVKATTSKHDADAHANKKKWNSEKDENEELSEKANHDLEANSSPTKIQAHVQMPGAYEIDGVNAGAKSRPTIAENETPFYAVSCRLVEENVDLNKSMKEKGESFIAIAQVSNDDGRGVHKLRRLVYCVISIVILLVIVVLAIFLPQQAKMTPTLSPTEDTVILEKNALIALIESHIKEYNTTALYDESTPQGEAVEWMITSDAGYTRNLPEEGRIQRFSLATFYHSMGATLTENKDECNINGITCNGKFQLETLNLPNNELSLQIPGEIGLLTELTHLNLQQNEIFGRIPTELGMLSNLKMLSLWGNTLSGELPTEIGLLTQLTYLWLGWNEISESIPSELGRLPLLKEFYIYHNNVTGSIPTELGQLISLITLRLNNNDMSGSIPTELGMLKKLTYFDLYENKFTGSIPCNNTLKARPKIDCIGITCSCCSDANGDYCSEEAVILEKNALIALIESHIKEYNTTALYDESTPQSKAVEWMITSDADYTYRLSEEERLQRFSLVTFYYSMGATAWITTLQGTHECPLPLNNRINCNGRFQLQKLSLPNSGLSLQIPGEIGLLTELTYLNLQQNKIFGRIPTELGMLSNLKMLSLWSNTLSGELPTEIGLLTQLTYLWLGWNAISESIPSELGRLPLLKEFYIYHNNVTGSIPTELGQLTSLIILGLNNNYMSGSIPTELGMLKKLTYFDLYENKFTGSIPCSNTLKVRPKIDCIGITCSCCLDATGAYCSR